jgi:hypothetical protein
MAQKSCPRGFARQGKSAAFFAEKTPGLCSRIARLCAGKKERFTKSQQPATVARQLVPPVMPSPNINRNGAPTHEEIAACAYLIWINEGCPGGRDKEHWIQAETQLHATRAHDGWTGGTARPAEHAMGG